MGCREGLVGVSESNSVTASTGDCASSNALPHARLRRGLVRIHPISPNEAPQVWQIEGSTELGRSRKALVQLADASVSRSHAALEPREGGFWIRDQGSRHGTFVNAKPVVSNGVLAQDGSVVRVGDTLLLVVDQVERYRTSPRRLDGAKLGLPEVMVAGPSLAEVWDEAARVAELAEHVLIWGESGSGKECVARILHAARSTPGPFVGINVSAIPEGLFEAELFGHERGAFTGADQARPGAFREASGGVLFLDEIGDVPLEVQPKLLRALDRLQIRPLGATREVHFSARIVTATSRQLVDDCESAVFRADLYYRLSAITIRVPPLRERPFDVLLLAEELLRIHSAGVRLSSEAAEVLALASWPGNARQLRQALLHALRRLERGQLEIRREHLPDGLHQPESGELTRERLQSALQRSGGVASHAARTLGVSRTTFYKTLRRLGSDAKTLLEEG
jgi:DNA-binding NtrC family response regulator